ncbi:MAG: hypothetical protein GX417_06515 [Clostridiales bacterium]|nr:hypothetical protein [Clostridiales bacterium]
MKKRKTIKILSVLGLLIIALALIAGSSLTKRTIHSECVYTQPDTATYTTETIAEEPVPLAGAQPTATAGVQTVALMVVREEPAGPEEPQVTPAPAATPAPQQTAGNTATPTPEAEDPENDPEAPAEESDPTAPQEPTPTPAPAKAQKPDDITNVTAMAKYLFDAATEFWATEKDFCGTTTRPVSTRVAASIGAGTAVDCPGGDTVRIDANGVAHDSYAIADHFRDYVDMPDLQYFKIYLSDKDYSVDPYGAREDVIGSYYQYGSERATYQPEDEEEPD